MTDADRMDELLNGALAAGVLRGIAIELERLNRATWTDAIQNLREAADEAEAWEHEVERLREALAKIQKQATSDSRGWSHWDVVAGIAAAALQPLPPAAPGSQAESEAP